MEYEEVIEWLYDMKHYTTYGEQADAIDIAIEALGKQRPKKPIGDLHSVPHHRCPNCNGAVRIFEVDYYDAYCKFCGQALDWKEE